MEDFHYRMLSMITNRRFHGCDTVNRRYSFVQFGFSPTRENMKDFLKEYVDEHNIANSFKDNRPGKNWVKLCLGRNNLYTKKANMISSARKSAIANPFIIHDFFYLLEEIMKEKKTRENMELWQVWFYT